MQILGRMKSEYSSILTPEAVQFAGHIQRKFGDRVLDLLQKRKERQARYSVATPHWYSSMALPVPFGVTSTVCCIISMATQMRFVYNNCL